MERRQARQVTAEDETLAHIGIRVHRVEHQDGRRHGSYQELTRLHPFDGLLHNDVVESDIHSTDTHGYAEGIFGTAYLLGLVFAPRIKGRQDQQLYSFEKRKVYEDQGFKILPQKYVNVDLIKEHWDELLRLIATMKLKETTASQIFKRFNSYSKQHILYQALKLTFRLREK